MLGICVGACTLFSFVVGATPNPNLTLQIVPLECSLDTTAVGQITSQQITPEACRPFSEQINTPVAPPDTTSRDAASLPALTVPTTYYTTQVDTALDASTAPQNTKDALEVRGVRATTAHGKDEDEHGGSLVLPPVAAALLITVVAIIPTGSIAPIISQIGAIRLRLPWFK